MKKAKIIMVSIVFYIVGFLITFAMFSLWFWLFKSPLWQTTFIIITLLGLMKYVWQHTEWTISNLRK